MILQRDALLRLLAGLVIAVRIMSFGPLANLVPRWVVAYVSSVLDRAEAAAQYLVIIAAAESGLRCPFRLRELAHVLADGGRIDDAGLDPDDLISSDRLWSRIAALREVLGDLSGHAVRLIQRVTDRKAFALPCLSHGSLKGVGRGMVDVGFAHQRFVPRIERPPDKGFR